MPVPGFTSKGSAERLSPGWSSSKEAAQVGAARQGGVSVQVDSREQSR